MEAVLRRLRESSREVGVVEDMHEKSAGAMTEVRGEAGLHRGSARSPPSLGE